MDIVEFCEKVLDCSLLDYQKDFIIVFLWKVQNIQLMKLLRSLEYLFKAIKRMRNFIIIYQLKYRGKGNRRKWVR